MTKGSTSPDPYSETPVPRGQIAKERAKDWEQYAAAISRESLKLIEKGGPDPAKWPKPKDTNGSLVVIGSGIKSVCQFTVEALGYLHDADQVLYHVTDPVTKNYIRKMNPNAKDLSVLYDNTKDRIQTYYQMAEAMLYPLRHGQKVVTIYYGHPGIFVYASHRAIRIAHKQGLKAKMLPGVSVLDCLFADLGVDPSYPGLQVLEATDLLVRNRKILTDGHVVILQVGCVGDRGYRRQGYLMHNFHHLVERLQCIYGAEYKITNYTASRLPSVKPKIQIISLKSLQDPEFVKKNITVSTFYIPPKDTRKTDPEMARKLGLASIVKPEIKQEAIQQQTQKSASQPAKLRDISRYGSREQNSLKMLSSWKVPGAYDSTPKTAAAHFMISLAQEPKKVAEFQKNPGKLANATNGVLPLQARNLASGNRAMVRMAVKPNSNNAAMTAAIELFSSNSFSKAYADVAKKYVHSPSFDAELTSFLELHGFKTTPDAVQIALQDLRKTSLLPWRQVYHTSSGILEIRCKNAVDKGQVIWKSAPVQNFTFSSSTLTWKADAVNQSSAVLNFTTEDGLPLFTGKLWDENQSQPASQNINGTIENFISPVSIWRGNYRTTTLAKGSKRQGIPGPEMSITFNSTNPVGSLEYGGKPVVDFNFEDKKLSWANGEIIFYSSKATVSVPSVEKFYGYIWSSGEGKPSAYNFWGTKDSTFLQPWSGKYKTFIGPEGKAKGGKELIINGGLNKESSTVQYGGKNKNFQFNNPVLSWQDNGKNVEISFLVFRNKKLGFSGKMWSTNDPEPSTNNFEGVFDSIYLDAWLGAYYTKNAAGPRKTTDGEPFSIVKHGSDYRITYNGSLIKSYNYEGAKRSLHWSTDGNDSSGSLQFYIPTPDKGTGLHFFGKVWAKGQPAPDATNFWGSTVPFPGAGSYGTGEQQLVRLVKNLLNIALQELLKSAWKRFTKWLKSKTDGSSKEEQEKLKKESEEADEKADNQEEQVNDQEAKTNELDPEADLSSEAPTIPDPVQEPPSNAVETDTDTTDTDTTETDTDTDVDTDVDVDADMEIVVDVCSLM